MTMRIFLVRPHPPAAIMARACPIPEDYKYNWQPMALKYIAFHLKKTFGEALQISIWHLMTLKDDEAFQDALMKQSPEIVAFSEIDILVNEVSWWAAYVKKILPRTWTLVGGKHTSLLREGDRFPFEAIDFALRGDSIHSLNKIIEARMEGKSPTGCPAIVRLDEQYKVVAPITYDQRTDLTELDGIALQDIPVEHHSLDEYLENNQIHPALIKGPVRTASVFAGGGCPHQCVFCQSPVEYGDESGIVKTRVPEKLAEEIAWLVKKHRVNNIFSLEANLSLKNWLCTYECLEQHGIPRLAVSGFVRAADIVEAYREGVLQKLAQKGMRVLSVGLDVPFGSEQDVYRKAFSQHTLMDCLTICEELGILLSATFVGDPGFTLNEFQRQLQFLNELPIAAVDIRLAIALRNTEYFRQVSPWLIYHPEDRRYFSRQNYRYQTIRIPGKITPKQTYGTVRSFRKQFLTSDAHLDYVLRFARRFPEAIPFFRRQYQPVIAHMKTVPEKLGALAELLGLSEAGQ
jgi:radical SAM superfamily enzyme YgiQ (UPF0313 family)